MEMCSSGCQAEVGCCLGVRDLVDPTMWLSTPIAALEADNLHGSWKGSLPRVGSCLENTVTLRST